VVIGRPCTARLLRKEPRPDVVSTCRPKPAHDQRLPPGELVRRDRLGGEPPDLAEHDAGHFRNRIVAGLGRATNRPPSRKVSMMLSAP
jgi:hypothetical protein